MCPCSKRHNEYKKCRYVFLDFYVFIYNKKNLKKTWYRIRNERPLSKCNIRSNSSNWYFLFIVYFFNFTSFKLFYQPIWQRINNKREHRIHARIYFIMPQFYPAQNRMTITYTRRQAQEWKMFIWGSLLSYDCLNYKSNRNELMKNPFTDILYRINNDDFNNNNNNNNNGQRPIDNLLCIYFQW